ncbi:hypothetical protein [Pseudomonas amygdali]|uniref:Uncharacterized protein n=2 Tax=Pseudomonas amygdali pv. lachrymans TaxID=53707 RepID=A0ABR5KTF9_PSEAV|nr:hypothetical protein [Pseudomonas amygdali]AXH59581.1 hypothetical protein PLA107_030615 [Pseudomonas amygdali pv. lachrymans str. M301315]KPC17007.1 Uncharacterized protein AC499_0209 [Pseudomonas amygdali pv. lachrymans]KPC17966.1 Uncharacterized protein AC499_1168 [Pseudomonas amygdali pv. lachrymans]RMT05752.1 hypothetical protein ALP54_03502 [Pseudomonas amygdali pv. lachrymans]
MFPSNEIESFYQEFKRGAWVCSDLIAIAPLCEAWILSLDDLTPSGFTHLPLNPEPSQPRYSADRMLFAMSLALSIPSERTGEIFSKHFQYMQDFSRDIGGRILEMGVRLNVSTDHSPIDVLKAFKCIEQDAVFVACRCYAVDPRELRQDAFIWDDLDVFLKTLPTASKDARDITLSMIASVHEPEGTAIYQHFVNTQKDEANLFRAKIYNLRHRLLGDYTRDIGWIIERGEKFATLIPGKFAEFRAVPLEPALEVFNKPSFADKLHQDIEHLIKNFFHRTDEALRNTANANQADIASRAFMDAGVSPETIITLAVLNRSAEDPVVGLPLAMGEYAAMGHIDQDFYAEVYRRYLADFTPAQIIDKCFREETFQAAYKLTGNKEILAACNGRVRDTCFGNDLGL